MRSQLKLHFPFTVVGSLVITRVYTDCKLNIPLHASDHSINEGTSVTGHILVKRSEGGGRVG